ncbi:uncharacterized protein LOC123499092 [Portunus trituberculatus]|uniref:uncharacterized protein LOC123499092 n=1 Tax=Portunus trituberculatus TaxID=210409 RepID=UPI001E1CB004|nr:uncharacterized protein LOC123499092 [Portunus trituberculatus]
MWLPPHISLTLPRYTIIRRDRPQGRSGGVLLAFRNSLIHTQLTLPQWQGSSMEVVAAQVGLQSDWLTVVACYNPAGNATQQEYDHYFSTLPQPVLIMGDFNTHHQRWNPSLLLRNHNPTGTALFQTLLDSPHLSFLSPPGLATYLHPHTGAPSVLDLFLGDSTFQSSQFSTGSYMGSDHLPLLATLPHTCPRPHPGLGSKKPYLIPMSPHSNLTKQF